jgi:glycerophosphoryl diester phosphodiesterase
MIELRRRPGAPPLRIAHRGAPFVAPENTLRSLRAAVGLGVDAVEFDVLRLDDDTLVLAHSDDLLDITHGAVAGRAHRMTLAELHEIAPELPTLDDALTLFRDEAPDVGVHIDLKRVGYEARVVDCLRRHGMLARSIVSSPFAPSVIALARADPTLQRGFSYPVDRYGVSSRRVLAPLVPVGAAALRGMLPRRIARLLRAAGASFASLYFGVISRQTIARCHAAGAAVVAWTVDDPRVARRLVSAGVDGIVTNDPQMFGLL